MDFSINKFFEPNECPAIIEFAEKNGKSFSYNPKEVWDCRRIYDEEFKQMIVEKLKVKYNSNEFKLWFDLNQFQINDVNVSLTKYYENRWLDLHIDSTSQFTTVIVLSDDFHDGRFTLSDSYKKIGDSKMYQLNIGESISFDGSKIYHGVLPVTKGIRYALNIWMTNTDFKYHELKTDKSLI